MLTNETTPDAVNYLFNCFVSQEDTFTADARIPGPEAIYTGKVDMPRILVARTDLPGGPMGDEMWYRLTTGLEHLEIKW